VIIFVVAAKIWYLKNVQFLLGHPVLESQLSLDLDLDSDCQIPDRYCSNGVYTPTGTSLMDHAPMDHASTVNELAAV